MLIVIIGRSHSVAELDAVNTRIAWTGNTLISIKSPEKSNSMFVCAWNAMHGIGGGRGYLAGGSIVDLEAERLYMCCVLFENHDLHV